MYEWFDKKAKKALIVQNYMGAILVSFSIILLISSASDAIVNWSVVSPDYYYLAGIYIGAFAVKALIAYLIGKIGFDIMSDYEDVLEDRIKRLEARLKIEVKK